MAIHCVKYITEITTGAMMIQDSHAPVVNTFAPPPGDFPPTPRKSACGPFRLSLFRRDPLVVPRRRTYATIIFWLADVPDVFRTLDRLYGARRNHQQRKSAIGGEVSAHVHLCSRWRSTNQAVDTRPEIFDAFHVGEPITVTFLRMAPSWSASIRSRRRRARGLMLASRFSLSSGMHSSFSLPPAYISPGVNSAISPGLEPRRWGT